MYLESLKQLHEQYKKILLCHQPVEFYAWVRFNRVSKKIGFLSVTDGTFKNLQVVYKINEISNFEQLSKLSVWSAIKVNGFLVPRKDDELYEVSAHQIDILAISDSNYPLQNKEHSLEFLRDISHLRVRSNLFNAVMKIRSEAAFAINNFYHSLDFVYLNSPEITQNDGEGAGENFVINSRSDEVFFGQEAYLTVSGQLHAEAYAQALKSVYTFGPTFRAENSHTNRHISEFWMIEPEMAFHDKKYGMDIAEYTLKYVMKWVLEHCVNELSVCSTKNNVDLVKKLNDYIANPFPRITYEKAIQLLQNAITKKDVVFENNDVYFDIDLASEHEKYLCEKIFNAPLFITDYPKQIKAFYMKLNPDQKTVAAYDCLIPGIGEVVGGSERESNFDLLMQRCQELNINPDKLDWYIDLRKYGYFKSVGFGIGFERMVMMLTGMENIRDVIPFPRFPGSLKF